MLAPFLSRVLATKPGLDQVLPHLQANHEYVESQKGLHVILEHFYCLGLVIVLVVIRPVVPVFVSFRLAFVVRTIAE